MSQQSTSSLKPRLEAATRAYQDLQDDLEKAVASRAKLEAQLLETENVKKEFTTLKPHNTIYKLVGPVLVPQEQSEAKINVDTRLEFIRGEMKRIENQIKEFGDKSERAKSEIVEIQTAHQAILQQQAGPSSLPAVKA